MDYLPHGEGNIVSGKTFSHRFRRWLFAYTVVVMLFLGVMISAATIWPLYGRLKEAQENHLVNTAKTRAVAVDQWLRRGEDLARQISSRTMIRQKLEAYNAGEASLNELRAYSRPKLTDAMHLSDEVVGITRLAGSGRPVVQCGRPIAQKYWPPPPKDPFAVAVGDPFFSGGALYLVIRAPIINRRGKSVGVDLVLLDTSALRRLITDRSGLGKTGCVILGFKRQNLAYSFLSSCRQGAGIQPEPSPPAVVAGAMGKALLGSTRLISSDEKTIARASVQGSNWAVVVGMDGDELYGPVIRSLTHTLLLAAFFTAAALVGLWLLLRPLAGKMIFHTSELEEEVRERKRAQKELNRLNQELASEHEQRKELSKRLIELLEGVRREVARDLHDHTGQILTTLRMDLEEARASLPAEAESGKVKLDKATAKLNLVQRGVKDIARGLLPPTLDYVGLIPSLEALLDDCQASTGLEIRFFTKDVPERFDREKELALYRIAQEAITNVIKHAQAQRVHVNLVGRGEILSLSVEDDGVGFDPQGIAGGGMAQEHLGLILMKERVIQLGGEFSVDSRPGGGTHLVAEVPL
jgi:signal transduction histidine kinase